MENIIIIVANTMDTFLKFFLEILFVDFVNSGLFLNWIIAMFLCLVLVYIREGNMGNKWKYRVDNIMHLTAVSFGISTLILLISYIYLMFLLK